MWLFLKYQTQRVLDWTNTGVWYGRILKLAAVVLVSLPLLRQLSILSTYPLEYALILLKSIVTGEILANLGFAAQVAVIYYPISFSVLAAILGLVGTRQLAVARETNKISRPLAPQLMQLVGFAWYLIMVPGLKVHKTAIGWVGFMTAFYVSFFIKSAVARFVGYTVQRTEGNPQWEGAIAEPREIDPEVRVDATVFRSCLNLSVVGDCFLRTAGCSGEKHVSGCQGNCLTVECRRFIVV